MFIRGLFHRLMAPEDDKGGAGGGGNADPANAPVTQAEFSKVVDIMDRQAQGYQQLTQAVQRLSQPKAKEEPAPDPTDIGLRIAGGDLEPVRGVARETAAAVLREQLGPWLQADIGDRYAQNEGHFRAEIDAEYKPGTYDEIFKPQVDAMMAANPGQRAQRSFVKEAINLVRGREYSRLRSLDAEVQKSRAEADEKRKTEEAAARPPAMLGQGMFVMDKQGQPLFDNEDQEWMGKFEAANGTPVDQDMAKAVLGAAIKGSKGQPYVRTSIKDLLTAGRAVQAARKQS